MKGLTAEERVELVRAAQSHEEYCVHRDVMPILVDRGLVSTSRGPDGENGGNIVDWYHATALGHLALRRDAAARAAVGVAV